MTVTDEKIAHCEEKIENLEATVFGNGSEGLKSTVNRIDTNLRWVIKIGAVVSGIVVTVFTALLVKIVTAFI